MWLDAYDHRSVCRHHARCARCANFAHYARCANCVRHTRFARYASALRGARYARASHNLISDSKSVSESHPKVIQK